MIKLVPQAFAYEAPPPITEERCRLLGDPVAGSALWADIRLKDLECLFGRVYWAAFLAVGGVFIIWAILSGMRLATAAGDEKATAAARRSFTFAVLGFIAVISAHALIKALGGWVGGPAIPVFRIPD